MYAKNATTTFVDNCIVGITANKERCAELLNVSIGIVTALCPYIGYKQAADIAKIALKTGLSVKVIVLRKGILTPEELEEILDPISMTQVSKASIIDKKVSFEIYAV